MTSLDDETIEWQQFNRRYLAIELKKIRDMFAQSLGEKVVEKSSLDSEEMMKLENNATPALEQVCRNFSLSSFERQLLLLCVGAELEADFPSLCASVHGDPKRAYPSFGLALTLFSDEHWDALSPESSLRYWHLLEVEQDTSLNLSALRISESVLYYLLGVPCMDECLAALVKPFSCTIPTVESQKSQAISIAKIWDKVHNKVSFPLIHLMSSDRSNHRSLIFSIAEHFNLQPFVLNIDAIPSDLNQLEALRRVLECEAILNRRLYLLEYDSINDCSCRKSLIYLMEYLMNVLVIATPEFLPILNRRSISRTIDKPNYSEQLALWENGLPDTMKLEKDKLQTLVAHFNLSEGHIHQVCNELIEETTLEDGFNAVWRLCNKETQMPLEGLIQIIKPKADWEDLILPEQHMRILKMIVANVKQRRKVYEQWGFSDKNTRGLGISALFYGPSGTGKTLAAEILAKNLGLDLYRVDLSAIISKYIGETEKNLKKIFDGAEESNAILLFDEADALFGKRSEVKDSHDRYANIEVSYLLQRIEAYKGLAILTSNLKNAIDTAFVRRIRFIVPFSFPNQEQRAKIWRRIFSDKTPTEDLSISKLASLNVAGGDIYNIALSAAFLAAEENEPVQMKHLLKATKYEFAKLEKPFTEMDMNG